MANTESPSPSDAVSYQGLIDHLEYYGYTHEEAVYAADHCGADWYEQALTRAKYHVDSSLYGLMSTPIEILEEEGFTHDQAVYGVETVWAERYGTDE